MLMASNYCTLLDSCAPSVMPLHSMFAKVGKFGGLQPLIYVSKLAAVGTTTATELSFTAGSGFPRSLTCLFGALIIDILQFLQPWAHTRDSLGN